MESQARASSDPVNTLDAMHQQPWEYDFFQALRRIECESPELPRLGHSLRLADERRAPDQGHREEQKIGLKAGQGRNVEGKAINAAKSRYAGRG